MKKHIARAGNSITLEADDSLLSENSIMLSCAHPHAPQLPDLPDYRYSIRREHPDAAIGLVEHPASHAGCGKAALRFQ
jgi:hypothetical protein